MQLAAFMEVLNGIPTIPMASLPGNGRSSTFWSLQHPNWPPLPFDSSGSNAWQLADGSFLVNDLNYDYQARTQSSSTMMTLDATSPPSPGGGGSGGTNINYPNLSGYTVDYGTNLWIAQWNLSSSSVTGIASNTIADVFYEIFTNSDIATTNWGSTGLFIVGSETTNWTALPLIPASLTNNCFFRLRSDASSDGSGLPDWWEQEYGVTDPYGDPDGDGWNNLQEYQNGTDPNSFDTPAAPQGLTLQVDNTGTNVTLSWLSSSGNVSQYKVETVGLQTDFVPASQTTYHTTFNQAYWGTQSVAPEFRVTAQYANGAFGASATVALESVDQQVVHIVADAAGHSDLVASPLPSDAVSILLFNDNISYSVAVSNLDNGIYVLPDGLTQTNQYFYGQILHSNGQYDWEYQITSQAPLPFYDGRVQLKQNLIFQLRAADTASPFGFVAYFYDPDTGFESSTITAPVNYVYASFYDLNNNNGIYGTSSDWPTLNIHRPFEDNVLYRNFVFTPADVDTNGNLTTGVDLNFSDGTNLSLLLPPAYQPVTNTVGSGPLLDADTTRWLCAYPMDLGSGPSTYDSGSGTVTFLNGFSAELTEPLLWTFAQNAKSQRPPAKPEA